MGKFRIGSYDPRADSSSNTEAYRPGYRNNPTGLSGVILDRRPDGDFRVCPCGCRKHVAGKSRFAMGHDMKLKGILIRAYLSGTPIHVLVSGSLGSSADTRTAIEEAARWSTPKLDWQKMLLEAETKQGGNVRAAIARAEAEVTERALAPQVGSRKLIRLGRWEYTGYVIAVWEDEGRVLYEYVDRRGQIQQVYQDELGES